MAVDLLAAIEDPPMAVKENHWFRQNGDDDRGLRLRSKMSLKTTARLRDRSQRRNQDRRSRSKGMGRKRT